jgi:hypothetical protein
MDIAFSEILYSDMNSVSVKDMVSDIASLDIEDDRKKRQKLLIPTCSCEYIKWVSERERIKCPDFGAELKPTKITDTEQCQYCGFYVCWKKIDIGFYESSAIPFWSQESWYRQLEDPDWYLEYQSK